jgi:NitT/TauT family transport system substrate-binding protein
MIKAARRALTALGSAAALVVLGATGGAGAERLEETKVVFAYQHGLTYLPFMVMKEKKLVEKRLTEAHIKEMSADYIVMGGPAPINDALVAERAQFGAVGVPSLVQLWSKTKGSLDVKTIGAMTSAPMFLNTNNPAVKTLKDFTDKDKIALPSVKVSVQAVALQMACAKEFGKEEYAKLDKLTVSMPHPDGQTALLAGSSGITAHLTGPPFQYQELAKGEGKVRRVMSSYDVQGDKTTFVVAVSTETFRKANPKAFEAVVAAFNESIEWINANKEAAADIYLSASKSKEEKADILKMLNDPDIVFTTVPHNVAKIAEFMHEVDPKNIKNVPASWKDLCFPHLHDKAGS